MKLIRNSERGRWRSGLSFSIPIDFQPFGSMKKNVNASCPLQVRICSQRYGDGRALQFARAPWAGEAINVANLYRALPLGRHAHDQHELLQIAFQQLVLYPSLLSTPVAWRDYRWRSFKRLCHSITPNIRAYRLPFSC